MCIYTNLKHNTDALHIAVRNGSNASSDYFKMNVGTRLGRWLNDDASYVTRQSRVKIQKWRSDCGFYLWWRIAFCDRSDGVNLDMTVWTIDMSVNKTGGSGMKHERLRAVR